VIKDGRLAPLPWELATDRDGRLLTSVDALRHTGPTGSHSGTIAPGSDQISSARIA
jgi:hypothetical protein